MPGDESGGPPVIDIIALYNKAMPFLNDGHGPKSFVGKGSSLLTYISRLNDCQRALYAGNLSRAKESLEDAKRYLEFTTSPIEEIERYLADFEMEINRRSR